MKKRHQQFVSRVLAKKFYSVVIVYINQVVTEEHTSPVTSSRTRGGSKYGKFYGPVYLLPMSMHTQHTRTNTHSRQYSHLQHTHTHETHIRHPHDTYSHIQNTQCPHPPTHTHRHQHTHTNTQHTYTHAKPTQHTHNIHSHTQHTHKIHTQISNTPTHPIPTPDTQSYQHTHMPSDGF